MITLCERSFLSLIRFVSFDQTPKIKIYHMVAIEHHYVIEGRSWLIATDFLEPEEAYEDGSIYIDGAALDEEDESGFVEAGVITGVTEVGPK